MSDTTSETRGRTAAEIMAALRSRAAPGSDLAVALAARDGAVEAGQELRRRLEKAEAERDRAVAAARQQVAAEIHAARLPQFAPDENPETVAKIMRNIYWRIAAWGSEAPYYQQPDARDAADGL